MLPPATSDRVFDALPESFPLTVTRDDGTKQTNEWPVSNKWWANPDVDTEDDHLPDLFVQEMTEGMLRESDQPVDDVVGEYHPDDPDLPDDVIAEVRGKRLYDEWLVTVADAGELHDVPADEKVEWLMYHLRRWVHFDADDELYTWGDTIHEIPVRVELSPGGPNGDTSDYVDDANSSSKVVMLRLFYTLVKVEHIETALGFDAQQDPRPRSEEGERESEVKRYTLGDG